MVAAGVVADCAVCGDKQQLVRRIARDDGVVQTCEPCVRRAQFFAKIGLTYEKFAHMLAEQQNKCKICCHVFDETHRPHIELSESKLVQCVVCKGCSGMLRATGGDLVRHARLMHYVVSTQANRLRSADQSRPDQYDKIINALLPVIDHCKALKATPETPAVEDSK